MTNRQLVSNIMGQLAAYQKDDRIPRRLILNTALSISHELHSQRLRDKSLFLEDSLFQKIECLELEQVDPSECAKEFGSCRILMRSVKKLPKSVYSRFGNSVVLVTSVDDSVEFDKQNFDDISSTAPGRYSSLYAGKPKYLVFDDYLYIYDYEIYFVNVVLLSLQRNDTDTDSECANSWDYTFVCSDTIIDTIPRLTLERLNVARQLTKDENPNMNSNVKS